MSSAKRFLLIALVFALALTIFAAFAPRAAHAFVATMVQVVNTAANPVAITGPVDASGSNVNVTNTPTVNLANGAAVALGGVDNSHPLPTFATEAQNSFVVHDTCYFSGQPACTMAGIVTVPTGKIAVLESISAVCIGNSGSTYEAFARVAGAEQIFLQFPPPITTIGMYHSVVTMNIKTYVPSGSSLDLATYQAGGANACSATLSGYMVAAQ